MSAIAHVPGAAWAATHRILVAALAVVLVAAVAVLTVVLVSGNSTAAAPTTPDPLPYYYDTCAGAMPVSAC